MPVDRAGRRVTASVLIGGIGAGMVLWYTQQRWRGQPLLSLAVFVAASFTIRLIIGRPHGWWYSVVALATCATIAVGDEVRRRVARRVARP